MMSDDELLNFYELDFFHEPPKWRYAKEEPPKSLLILDDCLGSPAILQSSGLTRISSLNRHIAPLETNHSGRSACGLAVIILSQSYRMNQGISRIIRENLSLLTLFKNKQESQLKAIKEELANVVDEALFEKAYERILSEFQIILNVSLEDTQKKLDKALKRNIGGQVQQAPSVQKAPTTDLPDEEPISDTDENLDE